MHCPYQSRTITLSLVVRPLFIAVLLLLLPASTELRAQSLPPNIDFSFGNFNNWKCYTGTSSVGSTATGPYFTSPVLSGPVAGRHVITSGTGAGPVGGFSETAPGGGLFSVKVGNSNVGAQGDRILYNIHVPVGATKYSLRTMFAVVFDEPGHQASENPSFQVVAYDSATGTIIPHANNLFISQYSIPGFIGTGPASAISYLPWTAGTVNLSRMGGRTVSLEVTALDCALSGHFGYGYFDVTGFASYLAPTASACDMANRTIKFNAPPGYKYYRWYDQSFSTALNGAADTNTQIVLPLPSTPQYYNLVLIPHHSLGIPDTIRSNVLTPGFSVSATGTGVCATPGSPVQLNTTLTGSAAGPRYDWYVDTSHQSVLNVPNPIVWPTKITSYYVVVTDTNGCVARDTVTVLTGSYHVNAGPDRTTCLGTPITLGASVSPASTAYTYSWQPTGGLSNAAILTPIDSPTAVGTQLFVLRVDSAACSVYDTLIVRTLPNTFQVTDDTACAGERIKLNVQGDTTFSYIWTHSDKLDFASYVTVYDSMHPAFIADTTTVFTVTAQYPGCPDITRQLNVLVEPVPIVYFSADTVFMNVSTPISLAPSVTPGWFGQYRYSWYPATWVDSPNKAAIIYSGLRDSSLYLTVTTSSGCRGMDSIYVVVSDLSPMVAPTAFMPGSAQNGNFRIVHVEQGFTFRSMRVYDRWGKKVFETSNVSTGWDGTHKGNNAPMGVYVFVLESVTEQGRVVTQQGNVTLIR